MFKYKLEIIPLSVEAANQLPSDKKQMLTLMLTLLAQSFKSMSEVQLSEIQADYSLLIESTQDLDFRLKNLGHNVKISKIS